MFSRDVLNTLMPEGQFWTPADGDHYDNLLEGISENFETVRLAMKALGSLRDPAKTSILSDLIKEFGLTIETAWMTESQQRQALASVMFQKKNTGAYDALEEKLTAAGFDVHVYPNDPAVDPNNFYEVGKATCLIANLDSPDIPFEFSITVPAGYWPSFFFVGGDATFDVDGSLLTIADANVPYTKRKLLKDLIIRYKPLHTWCLYVDAFDAYLDGTRYLDGTWYLDGFAAPV